MRNIWTFFILTLFFLVSSCIEEESTSRILVTEEVLFVSGEQVRLMGRLITNDPISSVDHGFYLSEQEDFSSPIIISLGEKQAPGRFIGETSGLRSARTYFAKSFIDYGAGVEFGNTIELNTLASGVSDFSPKFGAVGEELIIVGRNFSSDTKVFFGEQEAEILEIQFEARIRVLIPPIGNESLVPLTLQVQDESIISSELFEYQIGTYQKISEFPEPIRLYDNIFYQNANGFHIGLGSDRRISPYSKIQRYLVGTEEWQELIFPESSLSFAFFTDSYFGGGISESSRLDNTINRSFYRVEGNSFVRLPDLPFESKESMAFELDGSLFVLGGKEGNPAAVRKFEPESETWENLENSPENFSAENAFFLYQNQAYLIAEDRVIWRYNPQEDSWTEITEYPGSMGQGYGIGRVIGNKAYVGLYRRSDELWELNLDAMTWKSKNQMPGDPQSIVVGHFVDNEFIYIMRVPDITLFGNFSMDFYKFDPDGI